MLNTENLSRQRLEALLNYLAMVIDEHGDAYWPLFKRFESELDYLIEREDKINARIRKFL